MDKFCCLLYGESGVGKTPFAGTLQGCEKTSPCLLLDVDMGAMSLDSVSPRPTILPIEKWGEVQVVYEKMSKSDWKGLAELISKAVFSEVPVLEYRSVVIDSGTELEYNLRQGVIVESGNMEIPSQPDYLKTQERFRKMYRRFRDLPISFVMTAGIRELKDEVSGVIKHYPQFQPNLTKDLIRMTDLVMFMNVALKTSGADRKWVKSLQLSLTQRAIARDRSGKLSGVIEGDKFYWKDIVAKILV